MDLRILVANNDASINQSTATSATNNKKTKLFDCLCTNPDAKIKFRASDMTLKMHYDRLRLSASKSRSRAGGFYYMEDNTPPGQSKKPQGSMCQECSVIKTIMRSVAECEPTTLCINC